MEVRAWRAGKVSPTPSAFTPWHCPPGRAEHCPGEKPPTRKSREVSLRVSEVTRGAALFPKVGARNRLALILHLSELIRTLLRRESPFKLVPVLAGTPRLKLRAGWVALVLVLTALSLPAEPASWVGTWSAPSLSQRAVPIIVSLQADGEATEQIGDYRGAGNWKIEGNSARILWASEWIGLLRPMATGGCELLTWKKGSLPTGPPDDIQAARRVTDGTIDKIN